MWEPDEPGYRQGDCQASNVYCPRLGPRVFLSVVVLLGVCERDLGGFWGAADVGGEAAAAVDYGLRKWKGSFG